MEKKTRIKGIVVDVLTYVIVFMMFATITLCSFRAAGIEQDKKAEPIYVLNEGWKSDEGETISLPYKLDEQFEVFTISRIVDEELYRNNYMYFSNYRMGVEVYVNDRIVYELNRDEESLKNIHVNSMNLVQLKDVRINDTVSIHFYNLGDRESTELPTIQIGTKNSLTMHIYSEEAVTISCVVLIAVLFVVAIMLAIIAKKKSIVEARFISLGCFIFDAALWLITDSSLVVLLPAPLEANYILSYFSLMVLPLGILYFVNQSFKRKVHVLNVSIIIVFINLLVKIIFAVFNVMPLSSCLMSDQAMVILSIIICIIYSYKLMKEENGTKESRMLFANLILFSVLSIFALISYYVFNSFLYHTFITITVTLFFTSLITIAAISFNKVVKAKEKLIKERDVFKSLSYKDQLTQLGNVRSFEENLRLKYQGKINITLFAIDVNNIKRINDTYGHGTGNILLTQCAECMEKSFGQYGLCFRVGGDEFAAIVEDDKKFDPNELIEGFNDLIRITNGDRIYKLSIAIGYACSNDPSVHSYQDLRYKADFMMYEDKNKKKLKDVNEQQDWEKMIESIVSIFEVKDPYTAQHSNRVSYLSKFIAEKMELKPNVVNDIFVAGKLHDIGKIGISDNILTKEGRLTDEEFTEIKKHPEIGEKIILSSGGMKKIAKIIRHHHERYNGSGYPDHIEGEDIPLESRVLAFADSIDAMTSNRCYRKALSFEECKKEIETNLGRLYDPNIGKVVLDNWEEILTYIEELKEPLN